MMNAECEFTKENAFHFIVNPRTPVSHKVHSRCTDAHWIKGLLVVTPPPAPSHLYLSRLLRSNASEIGDKNLTKKIIMNVILLALRYRRIFLQAAAIGLRNIVALTTKRKIVDDRFALVKLASSSRSALHPV